MKELNLKDLKLNPITLIGEEWWLITAGNKERGYNTMTAAWGQIGAVWDRPNTNRYEILPTATVFIRPQRYTKEFVDREAYFTLSVLDADKRKALGYLGTHSGRDEDKVQKAGLTPVFDGDVTYFAEAKLVLVCRKIYRAPLLASGFSDTDIVKRNYPEKDFHEMYVGEITKALVRE